ncbi:hypothetical protein GCM10010358_82410 [Streptomyces minutiscleroticus]|uniref:Uncharacterized protein n=1 Tax=Streptomyces minutiscleroticus TaxID=68238 RepID=A0A918P574_9ACTN|nr:hypothetical protein GCM10010358_82410 [Streptomyces minutiscleroticus]
MSPDHIEHVEHEGPKGCLGRVGRRCGAGDPFDQVRRGGGEELIFVRHVVVEGAGPGRQAGGQSPEGQGLLSVGVEDVDRSLDDDPLGQCIPATWRPPRIFTPVFFTHDPILT